MSFIYMIIFFVLMYYFMSINKEGQYTIRQMPAMQAIPEAVGRAAEMGRPVFLDTWYVRGFE
jgi:uncharacterized protein DUF6754